MKLKFLMQVAAISSFMICLIIFSSSGATSTLKGLNLCYNVIIPTIFPFTFCSLVIFECGFVQRISKYVSNITKPIMRLGETEITIFLLSLIGGFPVGAVLISNAYCNKEITKSTAERLLSFCVNSGPAFIIVTIGSVILKNEVIGYILLLANTLSAVTILLISLFTKKTNASERICKKNYSSFSVSIVKSTYEATQATLNICACVTLFSCISGIIADLIPNTEVSNMITSIMEITNGIAFAQHNVIIIAFLLGFAGLSVHLQIISTCKNIKINYIKFLLSRILHGLLNSAYTNLLLKIFAVNTSVLSQNMNASIVFSEYSAIFSTSFIALSLLFIASIRRKNKII